MFEKTLSEWPMHIFKSGSDVQILFIKSFYVRHSETHLRYIVFYIQYIIILYQQDIYYGIYILSKSSLYNFLHSFKL